LSKRHSLQGGRGDSHALIFVVKLDVITLAEKTGLDLAPVMVYADDVTRIVTEEEFVIGEMEN
jgi:hypothetical protein